MRRLTERWWCFFFFRFFFSSGRDRASLSLSLSPPPPHLEQTTKKKSKKKFHTLSIRIDGRSDSANRPPGHEKTQTGRDTCGKRDRERSKGRFCSRRPRGEVSAVVCLAAVGVFFVVFRRFSSFFAVPAPLDVFASPEETSSRNDPLPSRWGIENIISKQIVDEKRSLLTLDSRESVKGREKATRATREKNAVDVASLLLKSKKKSSKHDLFRTEVSILFCIFS